MSRIDDQSSHLSEDEAFEGACEKELIAGQAIHCCPGCQPGEGGDIEITPAIIDAIKVNLKPEKVDFECPSCGDAMTGFVNFRQWYISPMAEDGGASSYFNHEGCSGAGGNYVLVCSFDGENLKFRGEPIPLELEEPEPAASGSAVEPFDYKNNPSALFHGGCGYEVRVRKSGDFVLAKAGQFPKETLPTEPTDVEVTCWECDEKFTVRLEDFFTEDELSSSSPSEVATPNPRALAITHSPCHTTRFWDLSLRPAQRGQEDFVFRTLLPRTKRIATATVPIVPVLFRDEPAAPADPAAPSATASWVEGERSRIRTPPIPITRPVPTIVTPSPLVTPIHRPAAPTPQPVARQPVPVSTPLVPIATQSPRKPAARRPSSTATAQEKTMVIRQGPSSTQKLILAMILGALGAGAAYYAFLPKGSSKRPRPVASAPAATPKDDSLPIPIAPTETISTEPPCPGTVWCSFPKNPDSAAGEPFRAECFGATAEVKVETYDPIDEKARIRVTVRKNCSAVVEIPEAGETNPVPVHFDK